MSELTRTERAEAEERVVDGTVWREFCRNLEKAGDTILRKVRPRTPSTGQRACAT